MTKLPPILEASAVHDRRMLPVWLMATAAAGMVNTVTFLACQRFVTHVTGTLTHIGADYARLVLLADYGLVLLAFVLGAVLSFVLIDGRRMRGKAPHTALPIVLVSMTLAVVSALGMLGAFGPFGQTVETSGDFVLLSMLAFSMGLQNASIATTTGMIVRTTHMTGPLTDFSIALGACISPGPPEVREKALESVALRGSKILSFVGGCAIGAALGPSLRYATYLVPASLLVAAALMLRSQLSQKTRATESVVEVSGNTVAVA